MALAMPDVDVDVTVLEALDFTVCCEWTVVAKRTKQVLETCDAAATWVATFPCCGRQMLLCDRHKPLLDATVRQAKHAVHTECGNKIVTDMIWSRLEG